jgi:hypothetical protein
MDEEEQPEAGSVPEIHDSPEPAVVEARSSAVAGPALAAGKAPNLRWPTRGVIAGGAAIALVAVLVGGLLLVATSGSAGRPGPAGSLLAWNAMPKLSSGWVESPSPTVLPPRSAQPSLQPSGQADLPMPPTIDLSKKISFPPYEQSQVVVAESVAGIFCDYAGASVAVGSGRLYLPCRDEVNVIDLATNQLVARYPGLWQDNPCHMACVGPPSNHVVLDGAGGFWTSALISWKTVTERFDIASGRVTVRLWGYWLIGRVGSDLYLLDDTNALMMTLAIQGGAVTPSPDDANEAVIACGHLYGIYSNSSPTKLTRPAWSETYEPGYFEGVLEFGGSCWGLFYDGSYEADHGYHLAHFGESGVDMRSPEFADPLVAWNGTLWLNRTRTNDGTSPAIYQRIDPATWQLVGVPWELPNTCFDTFGAGGSIWCADAVKVHRMNVQMTGTAQ